MRERKKYDDYIHVTLTYLITIARMMVKISVHLKTVATKKKKDDYFYVTCVPQPKNDKGCGKTKTVTFI